MSQKHIERAKKNEELGIVNTQPQVYFVRDTRSYYVHFEHVSYHLPTALKAVDISFKIHAVLNLKYNLECIGTYLLLQRWYYNIHTVYDIISPSLAILLKLEKKLD